jgi:hypothetical protein
MTPGFIPGVLDLAVRLVAVIAAKGFIGRVRLIPSPLGPGLCKKQNPKLPVLDHARVRQTGLAPYLTEIKKGHVSKKQGKRA